MASDQTEKDDKTPQVTSEEKTGAAPKTLPPLGARPLPPLTSSARPSKGTATVTAPTPATPKSPAPAATLSAAAASAPRPASSPASVVAAPRSTPAAKSVTAEVRKAKQDKPPENDQGIWRMSRKNFLNVAGWFAFLSFLVTATLGAIRLMVPRVLYEPPSAFKAGYPEDYIVGEVNEKYKD